MPVGLPPEEVELQTSRSTSSLVRANTVSSSEIGVAFRVEEKSQLQLHRAAELRKTRTAASLAASEAASASQMQRSASGTLKYNERLTRAKSTSCCTGGKLSGKSEKEKSEMADDLAKTAAL